MNIKTTITKTTAIASALLIASTAMASTANAKDISPVTAKYKFSVKDKISGSGKASRTLKKSGNTWTYDTSAYAFGGIAKASQHATFTLTNNKVKPSSAKTSYKILGKKNVHNMTFNSKSVKSTYKKQSKTLSMPHQALDDLSLEVQIRQDLLNNSFTGNYYMVKKNKIVKTKFKKSGTATIKTAGKTYNTVRIDRVHSDAGRQTTFWLAPSLDYLPVKVVSKDDGTRLQLDLTSVK